MAQDPSKILLVNPDGSPKGQPVQLLEPYIVQIQYTLRVDARSREMAENIAAVGVSLNTRLALNMIAHGCQALDWTKENLEAIGVQLTPEMTGDNTNRH